MARTRSEPSAPAGRILGDVYGFLAFGGGAGLAPIAPGTFGTLVAVPIYALLSHLSRAWYLAIVLVLLLAGVRICRLCEERLGVKDHPGIVWDEIVGYLIAMSSVPFSWKAAVLGFVLFRTFDVLKPWPISRLDRTVRGGLGIMLDDAAAGAFTAFCLSLLNAYTGIQN